VGLHSTGGGGYGGGGGGTTLNNPEDQKPNKQPRHIIERVDLLGCEKGRREALWVREITTGLRG